MFSGLGFGAGSALGAFYDYHAQSRMAEDAARHERARMAHREAEYRRAHAEYANANVIDGEYEVIPEVALLTKD